MKRFTWLSVILLLAAFVAGWLLLGQPAADEAEAQGLVEYGLASPTQLHFSSLHFVTDSESGADLWVPPAKFEFCTSHETAKIVLEDSEPYLLVGLPEDVAATYGVAAGSVMFVTIPPETVVTVCGSTVHIPSGLLVAIDEPPP